MTTERLKSSQTGKILLKEAIGDDFTSRQFWRIQTLQFPTLRRLCPRTSLPDLQSGCELGWNNNIHCRLIHIILKILQTILTYMLEPLHIKHKLLHLLDMYTRLNSFWYLAFFHKSCDDPSGRKVIFTSPTSHASVRYNMCVRCVNIASDLQYDGTCTQYTQ